MSFLEDVRALRLPPGPRADQPDRRNYRTGHEAVKIDTAKRATMPSAPCWNCGARGWCDHRKPEDW